jgi:hypothetical protein
MAAEAIAAPGERRRARAAGGSVSREIERAGYWPLPNPPVDSKEGIAILMLWAKIHGAVLSEHHERIAAKHGVDTEGVIFSRPIPLQR